MKRFQRTLVLCAGLLSSAAVAVPIEGVSVTTSFTTLDIFGLEGVSVGNLVDGSGLSSYSVDATHTHGVAADFWAAEYGETSGTITFDLGGMFDVDGMAVWNFSLFSPSGVNGLSIESSIDGNDFAIILGAPTNFSEFNHAGHGQPHLAQIFDFTSTARFVRFNVLSGHSELFRAVGMDEVMFTGSAVVPNPATLALFGLGIAALGCARRKPGQRREVQGPGGRQGHPAAG